MSTGSELATALDQASAATPSVDTLRNLATRLHAHLQTLSQLRLAELEEALGRSPFLLIEPLWEAADPEVRRRAAELLAATSGGCACSGEEPPTPTFAQEEETIDLLARRATAPILYLRERLLA